MKVLLIDFTLCAALFQGASSSPTVRAIDMGAPRNAAISTLGPSRGTSGRVASRPATSPHRPGHSHEAGTCHAPTVEVLARSARAPVSSVRSNMAAIS